MDRYMCIPAWRGRHGAASCSSGTSMAGFRSTSPRCWWSWMWAPTSAPSRNLYERATDVTPSSNASSLTRRRSNCFRQNIAPFPDITVHPFGLARRMARPTCFSIPGAVANSIRPDLVLEPAGRAKVCLRDAAPWDELGPHRSGTS